jgi:hypothetical protein
MFIFNTASAPLENVGQFMFQAKDNTKTKPNMIVVNETTVPHLEKGGIDYVELIVKALKHVPSSILPDEEKEMFEHINSKGKIQMIIKESLDPYSNAVDLVGRIVKAAG